MRCETGLLVGWGESSDACRRHLCFLSNKQQQYFHVHVQKNVQNLKKKDENSSERRCFGVLFKVERANARCCAGTQGNSPQNKLIPVRKCPSQPCSVARVLQRHTTSLTTWSMRSVSLAKFSAPPIDARHEQINSSICMHTNVRGSYT